MRSHTVTCHPAEVTFPPLPQPKVVLDLAIPGGGEMQGEVDVARIMRARARVGSSIVSG